MPSEENTSINDTLILVDAKLSRRPRTVPLDDLEMSISIGNKKEQPLNLTIPLLWTGDNAPSYSIWGINRQSPDNLDLSNMAIIDLNATEINRRLDMQRPTDLAFVVELIRQSTAKRIPIMIKLKAGDVENDLNIIEKKGSWYAYKGKNIAQGKLKTSNYLRDNKDVMDEIESLVRTKLSEDGDNEVIKKEIDAEDAEEEDEALSFEASKEILKA